MKVFRILFYWIPAISYMGLIWYVSSLTVIPGIAGALALSDKIKHIGEFFILSVLLYIAIRQTVSVRYAYALTLIVGISYGFIDEYHQSFVPGRVMSLLDVAADALGVFLIMGKRLWDLQVVKSFVTPLHRKGKNHIQDETGSHTQFDPGV